MLQFIPFGNYLTVRFIFILCESFCMVLKNKCNNFISRIVSLAYPKVDLQFLPRLRSYSGSSGSATPAVSALVTALHTVQSCLNRGCLSTNSTRQLRGGLWAHPMVWVVLLVRPWRCGEPTGWDGTALHGGHNGWCHGSYTAEVKSRSLISVALARSAIWEITKSAWQWKIWTSG